MKFEEAIIKLFQGKKIKRKDWNSFQFLSAENSFSIEEWTEYNDWEVVEEKVKRYQILYFEIKELGKPYFDTTLFKFKDEEDFDQTYARWTDRKIKFDSLILNSVEEFDQ